MTARKNGNVRHEKESAPNPPANKFQSGDVVALTPAALGMARIKNMTPRAYHQLTGKNAFLVVLSYVDPNDGPCVSLPCCNVPAYGDFGGNEGFVDPSTGAARCNGHPEIYFEKVDFRRLPKKGDKLSSLMIPWFGELAGFEYRDDEKNPEFIARFFGMGGGVTGAWAKLLKNFAEANNLM